MPNDNLKVTFLSHSRQPQCAWNRDYPDGIDVDGTQGQTPACYTELPYPAECCGAWIVTCSVCRQHCLITAAGRVDDPRSLRLRCETKR